MTSTNKPSGPDDPRDAAILEKGSALWQKMQGETPGVFNKAYWEGAILEWAMKDPSFKVDMFRFVDVFPTLRTKEQVKQHIEEYLLKEGRELPTLISAALKAATAGLTAGLAQATMKKQIEGMANRFIVGEDARAALSELKKLHKDGVAFTVDLLGEATVSEDEADVYARRYLDLIDNLADEVGKWPADEIIDRNHLGPIPRTNVSLKISAMFSQIDPVDARGSVAALKRRVLPLFLRARERNVALNVDLEQWAFHDITYDLFEDLVTHPQLVDWPHLAIVVQAYLKSGLADAERLLALAKRRGAPLGVRLVKGAYWDYETVLARQQGWDCPVFPEKAETDQSYEAISRFLLENIAHLWPAFGSHNLRSLTHALVLAKEMKVPERAFEVQMLYGMAEPERKAFRAQGHRVRVYAPVGELLPGMAYLVRRLLENTSNAGFLRLSHHDGVDLPKLMERPTPRGVIAQEAGMKQGDLKTPFANCALADFSRAEARQTFAAAVDAVGKSLPLAVPVMVAGKNVAGENVAGKNVAGKDSSGERTMTRMSPSDLTRKVADVALATPADAEAAVAAAKTAWPAWRDRPLEERAMLLEKLADAIEADRWSMAALQCFEVGKPWKEADGDVAEAVDFCRYYARQALVELAPKKQGNVWGEDNTLLYEGRGVCVVIAPWNFPLAILTGMATAALVAGNTVILKPAEQSSAVAFGLYQKMMAAGFPPEVVHFLPGVGEEVGPVLVNHLDVAQIAFTGSKNVGLQIVEAAHKTQAGQAQVKRVVCEMGGKNAIIVDDDADLDEAVHGVIKSAFGFAGQKCSACSRVLVLDSIADAFVERLKAAAQSVQLGPAQDPGTSLGPVVDEEAHRRLTGVIQDPQGAEPLYVGAAPHGGWYVPPAIFAVKDQAHMLMQRELFGPVLAVARVKTFDEALTIATATEFALTGAVFSRSPAHLEEARRRFRVGNLYLNRGSTGALVDRQPFGGFGMSGIGTKAGGPGYLQLFADPRVVTENTMRRGFTPELEG
jgi:RHH-type transcriptional regulator, proline utilization regulon repressor / proline dehydrogenase / delta 1-pyrroline-5-carboxylate dehydrogenase